MTHPEKTFRSGALSASIWKNEGKNKEGETTEFNTVTIERRYMDKDGEWQSTKSLRVNDLPRFEVLARKAYEHLILTEGAV